MQPSESEQECTFTSCLSDCSGHTQLIPATSWDIRVHTVVTWRQFQKSNYNLNFSKVQCTFAVSMVLIFNIKKGHMGPCFWLAPRLQPSQPYG